MLNVLEISARARNTGRESSALNFKSGNWSLPPPNFHLIPSDSDQKSYQRIVFDLGTPSSSWHPNFVQNCIWHQSRAQVSAKFNVGKGGMMKTPPPNHPLFALPQICASDMCGAAPFIAEPCWSWQIYNKSRYWVSEVQNYFFSHWVLCSPYGGMNLSSIFDTLELFGRRWE